MITWRIGERLSPAGGISITGADLSQPLSPDLKIQILAALRHHHVVVFPNQLLSREEQYAFAANFGGMEPPAARNLAAKRYRDGDHDYDNRYGSRDEYKREYRAAFQQGYQDGYGRR